MTYRPDRRSSQTSTRQGASAAAFPAELPSPLTTFVGRADELAEIVALVRRPDTRLLTLAGPGGIGKTRLALAVGALAAPGFADGGQFVPLAPVSNPIELAPAIATVIGVREAEGRPLESQLIAWLQPRETLLILDNFEQIIGASPFVSTLLATCPRLTVLVTSRVVLRLSGEQVYDVPPLPLPAAASIEQMEQSDAVRLFVARAQAARPAFTLTAANAATVAALCRELDGSPLAIELAAARLRYLSPDDLLSRMSRRLAFLIDGPLDVPPRLRSMRDAIGWSHDLLTGAEQMMFRRLAVFAGGFTIDAAEAIVLDRPANSLAGSRATPVMDTITSLVDKSLLRADPEFDGPSRFTMLETVREYALERLTDSGEETAVREAHAAFFVDLASRFRLMFFEPDGIRMQKRIIDDRANLRAAVLWLLGHNDRDGMLRMSAHAVLNSIALGQMRETRAWLEWATAVPDRDRPVDYAQGLIDLGILLHLLGEEVRAKAMVEDGIALLRANGAREDLFPALTYLGLILLRLMDFPRATAMQTEALGVLEQMDDQPWVKCAASTVLGHLGNIAVAEGAIERARAFFTAAIDQQRALGFEPGESHIFASHPIAGLGDVARATGEPEQALAHYLESLRHARSSDDRRAICYALGGVAGALAAADQWQVAARLFGASEALHEASGLPFDMETMDRQRALGLPEPWLRATESFGVAQRLHDLLAGQHPTLPPIPDPDRARRLWADGRTRSMAQAVEEALEASLPAADERMTEPITTGPHGLTPRELDVLRLIVEGMSDPDIADRLFISRRTAATHVANILRKLNVSNRAAAAVFAVRHGLA